MPLTDIVARTSRFRIDVYLIQSHVTLILSVLVSTGWERRPGPAILDASP